MVKRTRLGGFVLIMALALTVSACSQHTVSNEAPPEAGDVAVARVNGETIWTSDVRNEAVAQGQIGPGEPLDTTSDLFSRTLEEVIDQRLLANAATAKGLDKSAAARRRLRAAQDRILGDMLVETTIDRNVDDKDVKAEYDEQVRLSKKSEEIRTRLILLKTKADAEAVMKQIQGGGVFEAIAMEKSIDQATRFNGGDMGYFTTDIMPQAYKPVLMTAKIGDTVGPVQTDGGWAVLRIEDRRPEQLPTLEEERPVIMRYLIYNKVAGLLSDLRNKSKVDLLIPKSTHADGDEQEPANAPSSEDMSADAGGGDGPPPPPPSDVKVIPGARPESSSTAKPVSGDALPAGHHFFAPASSGKKH